MSEKRFEVFQECEYLEEWSSCPYCIKYDGETVFETLPLGIAKEVCKKLNEQQDTISALKEENEQLRRLFEEMKQPITINLTEEDEKELRKLLGLIDDE